MDERVLVACKDDDGVYVVATRQLMTVELATEYMKSIPAARAPIMIHACRDWKLRA